MYVSGRVHVIEPPPALPIILLVLLMLLVLLYAQGVRVSG